MNFMLNILFFLLLGTLGSEAVNRCDRTPDKALRPKNAAEIDKYIIEISGDPTSYLPGEKYKVIITYNPILHGVHLFREFMLSVEAESLENQQENNAKVGYLLLTDDLLSTFSRKCENTVLQSSAIPKSSIQVYWVAPPSGSGCVAFRATVVESKENWYSEDGSLTKILCEEESENEDKQPVILEECGACDEAKYELVFEGLWTRNTHPKDYPSNIWYTKFGDIVGSSHAKGESFWNYGEMASEELKLLGEVGDTSDVEKQLKEKMGKTVRTIIKANGLRYPNITGKTFTFFRVDQKNHLVSVVTKITPSPDWILGVSSFELCMSDGTWAERRVLNLYPWDLGTDDGVSYNSANEPSATPMRILAIKTDSEKSPFYDTEGREMKPFAKLYFTRLKIYKKDCEKPEESTTTIEENTEKQSEGCETGNWSEWSPCTTTCGGGVSYSSRELIIPENRETCSVDLVHQKPCNLQKCKNSQTNLLPGSDPKCALSDWSIWSSCSVSCGNGTSTRDKKFIQPEYAAQCENNDPSILQENAICVGDTTVGCVEEDQEDCSDTDWSPWTPCNVTCGSGNKTRLRMSHSEEENDEFVSECRNMEQVTCYEPLCTEGKDTTDGVFGVITVLNQLTTEKIFSIPTGPVANCKVSKWSVWGPCELISGTCGKGNRFKHRQILTHAMNGGKACPKKLLRKKGCHVSCQTEKTSVAITAISSTETNYLEVTEATTEGSLDCVMSDWSQWSPCSLSCGGSAVQQRTRSIKTPAHKNGKPCGPRLQQRACPLPLACSDKGLPIM